MRIPRHTTRFSRAVSIMRGDSSRLAAYKIPRLIEFRDELPKSTVVKILRRALRSSSTTLRTDVRGSKVAGTLRCTILLPIHAWEQPPPVAELIPTMLGGPNPLE